MAFVKGQGAREEGKNVFFGEIVVAMMMMMMMMGREEEMEEILVVRWQLGFPNGISGSGAAKSAIEASEVANLRRR